ncbi:MAG: hypothetical protein JSW06_02155 [Thermoplasmatales archaeon]|nr:MAG: hypothetical protein JSW06_02155 [Thermoplasmatales archaeon]
MKDKIRIGIGIGIAAAVIGTLSFYVLNAGNLELSEILQIGVVLILVVSAAYILWDRIKNIKKGLPAQDERLKITNYKACYYGFIAAIWSAVGAPLLSGILFDYEMPGHYVTAVVVLGGGLTFIISYLYLAWKGN